MVTLLLFLHALQNSAHSQARCKGLYSAENHWILQWYESSPEFHFQGVYQSQTQPLFLTHFHPENRGKVDIQKSLAIIQLKTI